MTTTSWPDLNSTTAPGIEVRGVTVEMALLIVDCETA
jgi:hypothetical protein